MSQQLHKPFVYRGMKFQWRDASWGGVGSYMGTSGSGVVVTLRPNGKRWRAEAEMLRDSWIWLGFSRGMRGAIDAALRASLKGLDATMAKCRQQQSAIETVLETVD